MSVVVIPSVAKNSKKLAGVTPTAAGLAILSAVDAAAQRTDMGLGTAATYAASSFLAIAGGTLTGNLIFTDDTYDIGGSGATRPRNGYFSQGLFSATQDITGRSPTSVIAVLNVANSHNADFTNVIQCLAPNVTGTKRVCINLGVASSANNLASITFTYVSSGSDSNSIGFFFHSASQPALNISGNSTNTLVQIGGQTSSYPALKRSGAGLQARLADDTGYTTIACSSISVSDAVTSRSNFGLGTVATLASDTDTALTANSDSRVATQKATKAYIDASVVGLWDFKTATDCSGSPDYPSASKADVHVVSVAGKIGGVSGKSVDVGDVFIATADNAGGSEASVGTSWVVLEHNLTGALVAANNGSDIPSPNTFRSNLGFGAISTQNANNVNISGGAITGITDLAVADGGSGASDAAGARTNFGLGNIATQAKSAIDITGGTIVGITDLAVADGGSGASDAAGARTNFGLGTISTQDANNVNISGGAIAGITDLAIADGGSGASTAAGARTNFGLGNIATQAKSAIDITGGTISNCSFTIATLDSSCQFVANVAFSGLTTSTGKLLGRTTTASGAIEEITVGTGLTLSGGNLTANGCFDQQAFWSASTITASTVYYFSGQPSPNGGLTLTVTAAQRRMYITRACHLVAVIGDVAVGGTLSSNHNSTLKVIVNNSGLTTVSSAVTTTATHNSVSNTALNIALAVGDYIELQLTGGAFTTAPTLTSGQFTLGFAY